MYGAMSVIFTPIRAPLSAFNFMLPSYRGAMITKLES